MLAEGLHSAADSGNEVMLLIGRRQAKKPADDIHPFGHGKELYFWTLVVALSVFAVGGVASVWEGIVHVMRGEAMREAGWNYATLGIAAALV